MVTWKEALESQASGPLLESGWQEAMASAHLRAAVVYEGVGGRLFYWYRRVQLYC